MNPQNPAADVSPRIFRLILLLTALIGLAIRVYVGAKNFVSFDEWQHVFMASSARWSDLSFELRTNAHPPLFFLLLRSILKLGNSALLYRSISIASGVGSIIVVGLIARRLLSSAVMALLCAFCFALSADAISVSVEIRSYQLAVFLALLAFWAGLAMCDAADGRVNVRACISFAVFSSLSVFCHYSAAFFIAACAAIFIAAALIAPQIRRRFRPLAATVAVPSIFFVIEYIVHAGAQPMQGYLADFYRSGTPGESTVSFVARNLRNFFNLFSSIEVHDAAVFFLILAPLCALAAGVFIRRLRTAATAAMMLAVVMTLELLAASLANKYPFGGLLRHQYIAGPFLLIAGFIVLDTFIPRGVPFARYATPSILIVAVTANLVVAGPKLILYPGVVLLNDEFAAWRSAFPQARAVYLDHWAVIAYFIHTSDRPRTFVRRIADDAAIDEYRLPDGTEIFYDKTRDSLDMSDPSVYRSLAACLRGSGASEISVFFFSPGDRPLPQPGRLEQRIFQRAADQGLEASKVIVGDTTIFADFSLK